MQCPRITSQMRPGKRFTLKAYSRALLRRQNLTSVGELRRSKQSSWLPRQVTMPDCTSCSWVLRRRIRRHVTACLSPRPCTHRRPQGCQQKQNGWSPWLLLVCFQRSFMMRYPVGSRLPGLHTVNTPRASHGEATPSSEWSSSRLPSR